MQLLAVLPEFLARGVLDMCPANPLYMNGLLIVSELQTFHSRSGRAYLFEAVNNITLGTRENRNMTTGLHEVSDVHCTRCNQLCGWRYVRPPILFLSTRRGVMRNCACKWGS